MGMRDDLKAVRGALEAWPKQGDFRHPHWIAGFNDKALAALSRLEAEAECGVTVDEKKLLLQLTQVLEGAPGLAANALSVVRPYLSTTPSAEVPVAERGVRQASVSPTQVYEALENVLLDGETLHETEDGNTAIDFHKITEAIMRLLRPGSEKDRSHE